MENEEKKVGCCGEIKSNCCGGKENCGHSMPGCCHNWKKCHMIKWILLIVALVIAFCVGSQWGEMKSERYDGPRFHRGGMMNWGENKYKTQIPSQQNTTGEVTVDVTGSPEVKQ